MGDSFEPIGQFYNAISPDESVQLNEGRFKNLILMETERYSEEHMNARMQRAMTECGLLGLKTEIVKTVEVKPENTRAEKTKQNDDRGVQNEKGIETELFDLLKVKERQIRNMLLDCYKDNSYVGKERVNGLPITLESRPDFAAWSQDGMMLTCEGKNKENFNLFSATRQCTGYMLIHLFYWLVTKSRLVGSVYGVAVAGAGCKGMNKGEFTVVLLRLSLPMKIGEKLILHKYQIDQSNVNSLEDLCFFANRVCNMKPLDACKLASGHGCPGLLQCRQGYYRAIPTTPVKSSKTEQPTLFFALNPVMDGNISSNI